MNECSGKEAVKVSPASTVMNTKASMEFPSIHLMQFLTSFRHESDEVDDFQQHTQ